MNTMNAANRTEALLNRAAVVIANTITTPSQRRAMFAKAGKTTASTPASTLARSGQTPTPRSATDSATPGFITPMPPGTRTPQPEARPGMIYVEGTPNSPPQWLPRPEVGGPDWDTPPPVTPPGRPAPPSAGAPIQEPRTRAASPAPAADRKAGTKAPTQTSRMNAPQQVREIMPRTTNPQVIPNDDLLKILARAFPGRTPPPQTPTQRPQGTPVGVPPRP